VGLGLGGLEGGGFGLGALFLYQLAFGDGGHGGWGGSIIVRVIRVVVLLFVVLYYYLVCLFI